MRATRSGLVARRAALLGPMEGSDGEELGPGRPRLAHASGWAPNRTEASVWHGRGGRFVQRRLPSRKRAAELSSGGGGSHRPGSSPGPARDRARGAWRSHSCHRADGGYRRSSAAGAASKRTAPRRSCGGCAKAFIDPSGRSAPTGWVGRRSVWRRRGVGRRSRCLVAGADRGSPFAPPAVRWSASLDTLLRMRPAPQPVNMTC